VNTLATQTTGRRILAIHRRPLSGLGGGWTRRRRSQRRPRETTERQKQFITAPRFPVRAASEDAASIEPDAVDEPRGRPSAYISPQRAELKRTHRREGSQERWQTPGGRKAAEANHEGTHPTAAKTRRGKARPIPHDRDRQRDRPEKPDRRKGKPGMSGRKSHMRADVGTASGIAKAFHQRIKTKESEERKSAGPRL